MFHFKILHKFLIPGSAAAAAALVKQEAPCTVSKAIEDASKSEPCKHCQPHPKIRPSELPLYGTSEKSDGRTKEKVEDPSELEKMIGVVRSELWTFHGQYKGYEQRAVDFIQTGKAHTESTLSFLREEATDVHRAGAIGLGGLAGLIMGLRGGWFKRIIYGTAGAAAMAALCYPREAAEIGDQSLQMAKYYFTIAYHFIYGVQPEGFTFLSSTTDSDKLSTKGATPPVSKQAPAPQQVKRDQSNPSDKDMYSNRS